MASTLRARDQRQIERIMESRRELSGEDVITTNPSAQSDRRPTAPLP
ncbi:hypothetical protein [Desulfurivibrio dismutans]|nr:hypothetical protein [Desulfurivibrio alkaliphilus]MDF1614245.1 hypothetical protein [Desulfurivibrio alkaliphilus]